MTYPEAVRYLDSCINYEQIPAYDYRESFGLERFKNFLKLIGSPQDKLRCIQVAGTKGKGSTCAFIAYILKESGFKVGIYTSPHLSDFRERIRILRPSSRNMGSKRNGIEGMISKVRLARLVRKLKPSIEKFNRTSRQGALSYFEITTALAFLNFKEERVDLAVLETGLGGRLDATNTVDSLVSTISPIGYEHTRELGRSLRRIATEKAGIIKRDHRIKDGNGGFVVSAPQKKEALEVIRDRCRQVGARLFLAGKDIKWRRKGNSFTIEGIGAKYSKLKSSLIGEHQMVNAAVAVGTVEALRNYQIKISPGSIRGGILRTSWPGRCEVVQRRPLIILDGAHTGASAAALRKTIQENFRYKKLILIFGISLDKDIKGVVGHLAGLADRVILTKSASPRATEPAKLAGYFHSSGAIESSLSVSDARALALRTADRDDLILVAGSLYVVGEFRRC